SLSHVSHHRADLDGGLPSARSARNLRPQGALFDCRLGIAARVLVLLAATVRRTPAGYSKISDDDHRIRGLVEFPGRALHQQHQGAVVIKISRALPVFSAVFPALYLVATYFNLALITYHPAQAELRLFVSPAKAGPSMYWYGWIMTSALVACGL